MPSLARAPDLSRLPININPRAVSLSEGIRAGLSVALIIAASEYLHNPLLREAALGALLTCICDSGGPIRRRVPVLIGFALTAAASILAFGLVRGAGPIAALPAGILGIFCATFLRIYGQAPQQLGGVLSTVIILSLDRAEPSLAAGALQAGAFLAGGLWATLLTLVLWRVYPFLPARRALGNAYHELSELVRDLHSLVRQARISDADWELHARIHRRRCRDAIEAARSAVLDTLKARGASSARAAQSVIRLETADQLFGALIALSDLLEHGTAAERTAAEHILRRMRPILLLLGRVVITDHPEAHRRIDRALDRLTLGAEGFAPASPLRAVLHRIIERLRIAHTLSVPANIEPGVDPVGRRLPLAERILRPLRANLSWQSPALRHALRAATAAAPALALTMAWFTPYDHWLTITIVATMQPYFSLTYTRAVERIVGTALGGVVAAATGLVCTTPVSMAAGMFVLSILGFAIRSVNFGLFMMGLTPMVVLLVETGTPEMHEWTIAAARAALTTIGGLIAVAANFLLWPPKEPELVAPAVRDALTAHAAYAEAAFNALLGQPDTTTALEVARRNAGVASNTLEALIARVLLTPGEQGKEALEAAMAIDAALRRSAGRLATLQHDPAAFRVMPESSVREWKDWMVDALRAVAAGHTALPPRPAGAAGMDTLARIARQIELIAGAMDRLNAGTPR
ncbi:MAG TPA: FUSC family protein [Rhodopila sp.]|nr:FUSC family protein [Rhodopila sp.]